MFNIAYSIVGIVSLFIMISINFDIIFDKNYKYRSRSAYTSYRFLLLCAAIFFLADIGWGFLNNVQPVIIAEIDTSIYFLAMSMLILAWYRFIVKYLEDNNFFTHMVLGLGYLFLFAGIALIAINYFIPILFSYETDTYATKVGRNIFLTTQIVMYAVIALYGLIRIFTHKGKKVTQHIAIAVAALTMSMIIILQYFFPLMPYYSIGLISALTLTNVFIARVEKDTLRQSIEEGLLREKEQSKQLVSAQELAYKDPLTGVKNKHAYVEFETGMDILIREKKIDKFSLFIFDLNDLKLINDTYGHETGDQYILKSCELVKKYFPGNIVYRFGGDEFIVYVTGDNYEERFKCLEEFNKAIEENIHTNEPIVAAGFSDYVPEKDNTMSAVFERADERMYSRKRRLKDLNSQEKSEEDDIVSSSNINTRLELYEMFYESGRISLFDMLNRSNCDELIEVDLNNDRFKQIYHVQGKYFIPEIEISYRELVDYTSKHIVHPDDVGTYLALMKVDGFLERLHNGRIPNFDFAHFRYKLQDGEYRWVEQCVITGEKYGIPEGSFRMYVFDIDNMKMRQLGQASNESRVISVGRDTTTGLLTGRDFFSEANKYIKKHSGENICFISIDIEHYKFFGEWFGREKGDKLLATIGDELGNVESLIGGLAGYFGQDDFALIMKHDNKQIQNIFVRIRNIVDSFGLTGGLLPAFGIAHIEKGMTAIDAFDRATIACGKAKDDIANRIVEFNNDMQFLAENEYRILTDFMKALQNDEITFYLQPQVRISNQGVVGAEALARWIKSDGTLISPATFIPVLEKYGFITDLDKYIWEKICIWIKHMLDNKKRVVPISINASRVDIFNIDFAEYLHNLVDKYEIPHKYIKVEITESAYAEISDKIDELVDKLHKDGFMVLMDDFGSGYSSLNMLSHIKIDAVKMDASFLHFDSSDRDKGIHILESVINMTKMMSLPIIMEGVENKEQCEFMNSTGVQFVQGYYFYRPMSIPDFEKLIAEPNKIDSRGLTAKANEQFRIREFLDKSIYSDSMLNSILGAVAIYLWHNDHVDIIRYNQQFFESVNVPDFMDKIVNMDETCPPEDRPLFFEALKQAKANRLVGSETVLRFYRVDGTLAAFKIHFYYLGKTEAGERFYGSAQNVTEILDLKDSLKLVSYYSHDNMIFITKIYDKWYYHVASHGLADVVGLTPEQLQEELNNGNFAKRVSNQKDLAAFMKESREFADKKEDFKHIFTITGKNRKKIDIELSFTHVRDESNNIDYILRTRVLAK